MEKTRIQYIKEAAKKLVDSKLQKLGTAKTQAVFQGVLDTTGLETIEEVHLFVAYFDLSCRDQSSNIDDLAHYFSCTSLDMIEYVPALKSLERKGVLVRRGRIRDNILKQDFCMSDSVMSSVIDNQPIVFRNVEAKEYMIDKYEFCRQITEKAENDDCVTEDIIRFTEQLENKCGHLPFISSLKALVEHPVDRVLFYYLCDDYVENDGDRNSEISTAMSDLYSNMSQRIAIKRALAEGTHSLTTSGLIELCNGYEEKLKLTIKGKRFYLGEDVSAFGDTMKCNDIYAFVKAVEKSFDKDYRQLDNGIADNGNYIAKELRELEDINKHLTEVVKIGQVLKDEEDRIIFYRVGADLLDDDTTSLTHILKQVYSARMRQQKLVEFKDKKHRLQQLGLVDVEKESSLFGESNLLVLTDKGKELLLGDDAALYIQDTADKQLLACEKITEKQLFFSNELDRQLSLLQNSLHEKQYQQLCARLKDNKLPNGMAVLLYGEPGTGKTESVLQMAKATGRDIMHVDISDTKTCWFGESEKLIKKVFTDYRRLCEKSKRKPILLFNEADAIFSKRKNVEQGSVAQTENAIQNIILEEMENLDGILIATTNLADNLDRAFERRFLFKIRFDKPTLEAKTHIWRSKLPALSLADAETLASGYDFSGGQIDNIVRKALMTEVIRGEKPTLKSLIELCSEEKIGKNNHKHVGFC